MELTQLKYFMCVAECEHMTRAAEKLHIAQPALTKTVHLLESELGVKLFAPKGRNIVLTECGKYLHEQLLTPLQTITDLPAALKAIDDKSACTIRINLLAASALITDAVIEYKKTHPEIIFSISQNETSRIADITVKTYAADGHKPDKNKLYFDEKIKLAVSKNDTISTQKIINLQECSNYGFIALGSNKHFRLICDEICHEAHFYPNIIFESDNTSAVQNLIAAGVGVGFWPEYSWGKVAEGVALIDIKNTNIKRRISIIQNKDTDDDSVKARFLTYLYQFIKRAQTMKDFKLI